MDDLSKEFNLVSQAKAENAANVRGIIEAAETMIKVSKFFKEIFTVTEKNLESLIADLAESIGR